MRNMNKENNGVETRENLENNEYTILLVDDDDDLRYLMAEYLSQKGYRVILASNGEQAFSIFNKNDLDIIITDIRMPKMNGLKLLRYVKEFFPRFPVIMMTGYELSRKDQFNMKYNADAYITKPFSLDYVEKIVNSLITKHRQ